MAAIRVEHLSRTFKDGADLSEASPNDGLALFASVLGFSHSNTVDAGTVTHALTDICLEVAPGSAVCLAGPSGSGKSTLLRVLAGALPPTGGRAMLRGRVVSLLSAGDNLDPLLGVSESIHRHARSLSHSPAAAGAFEQEVLGMSELENYRDLDIQQLSSGMRLRLSLAMALSTRADILIIDDVFGVGDISFRQRCIEALLQFKRRGGAIFFSTSDGGIVEALADRVLTMRGGRIISETALFTQNLGAGEQNYSWEISPIEIANSMAEIFDIGAELTDDANEPALAVSLCGRARQSGVLLRPALDVYSGRTLLFRTLHPRFEALGVPVRLTVKLPLGLLPPGCYEFGVAAVALHEDRTSALKARGVIMLDIKTSNAMAFSEGLLSPRLQWDTRGRTDLT